MTLDTMQGEDLPERQPVATAAISVVLPAYNDAATLEEAVTRWAVYLEGLARDHEILVVDDASSDGSASLAESLAARHKHLRLLKHESHRGLGPSLYTGIQAAQYPLLCYSDCSHGYRPEDLELMLKWIDHVDIVAGYRVSEQGPVGRGWGERVLRWYVRVIFALRLRDLDCLFLLARRSAIANLPILSKGMFAHTEVLAKTNFTGAMMTEVSVAFQDHAGARSGAEKETFKQKFREAKYLYKHPDFGPPRLPQKAPVVEPGQAEGKPGVL